jgi:hypothetical protein
LRWLCHRSFFEYPVRPPSMAVRASRLVAIHLSYLKSGEQRRQPTFPHAPFGCRTKRTVMRRAAPLAFFLLFIPASRIAA